MLRLLAQARPKMLLAPSLLLLLMLRPATSSILRDVPAKSLLASKSTVNVSSLEFDAQVCASV